MKLYLWNQQALYAGVVEVEPLDALPMRSTPTAPPKLSGTQVARWTGSDWEKLASAPAVEPVPEPPPDWAALIAARRYDAEVGGTVVGGMPIATDDRSKLLINGAALRANRSSDYVLRWKTSDGFVDLTADQVLAVADAVSEHVQACFDREDALLAAVADGTINAEMLEEGWPVLLH